MASREARTFVNSGGSRSQWGSSSCARRSRGRCGGLDENRFARPRTMNFLEAFRLSRDTEGHPPFRRIDDSGDLSWVKWDGQGVYSFTAEQILAETWEQVPATEIDSDQVVIAPDAPMSSDFAASCGHYTSTACLHDRHDECRQTCKFCSAACRCACHGAKEVPSTV